MAFPWHKPDPGPAPDSGRSAKLRRLSDPDDTPAVRPSPLSLVVRPIMTGDADACAAIDERSFAGPAWTEARYRRLCPASASIFFAPPSSPGPGTSAACVAVHRFCVVGTLAYTIGRDHVHVDRLATDPGYRRRGVARALVEGLVGNASAAWAAGAAWGGMIHAEAREHNDSACLAWRKLGFRGAGIIVGHYRDREDAIRFERAIGGECSGK